MRVKIILECGSCKRRNYNSTKNKRTTPDKLVLRKYCRSCRQHTEHKETK
jgi:large subunit ribosomal protein L33